MSAAVDTQPIPETEKAMPEVAEVEVVAENDWEQAPGVTSTKALGAAGLSMVGCALAFSLCFAAEFTDSFDTLDKFHPSGVALKSRHWQMWTRQFVPEGPFAWKNTSGMVEPIDMLARQSACIVKETHRADAFWNNPTIFDVSGVTYSNLTSAFSPLASGVSAYKNDLASGMYDIECGYMVPYTAIFGAMAASFLGFAAVAMYAKDVLSKPRGTTQMSDLSEIIHDAAMTFLHQEYTWLAPYVACLWLFLFIAIDGQQNDWVPSASTSFLIGAGLSASCGYFGMAIATEGNCRTAAACYSSREEGLERGLKVAFRTGACMGLCVVSAGAFGVTLCYAMFMNVQSLAGFGFGSSAVALFARVGGGIYTKAADVGADLCGKVDAGLAEDSPKNPATIADCVGDNVGDVAGMGADLFESFVGAVVAACVLGAPEFGTKGVALPLYIMMIGLVVSVVCSSFIKVKKSEDGKPVSLDDLLAAMRVNVLLAASLITIISLFLCVFMFEDESQILADLDGISADDRVGFGYPAFVAGGMGDSATAVPFNQKNPGFRLFGCVLLGLVVGILIGMVTEYFTSHTDMPTQSIAKASVYGPGPVVIQGLAMGMYSTVVPLVLICCAVLGSYYFAGFYGTAIACVGMLSTLGVTMSTDAYGPVSDNAGGIAEMCELPPWVRDYTDALDALGNTTAATGKGFANGSAVLSALATLTAFARSAEIEKVDLMKPVVVIGLLVGAMLPYLFAAMTMLSVNKAAQEMMGEVRRQFKANPGFLTDPDFKPDYTRCIMISCNSSLREMLMPGVLATFSPLIMGFIFGSHCLCGLLVGAISSGYLLGVMMSNTGGAWDNAKKYVEAGELKINGVVQGKNTECHKAAVCGDTVGDPFKDTSGPALNILIKLMTRFAFVLAPLFDDAWEHFWVGLVLLAVAAIIVVVIYFVAIKKSPEAEVEETEPVAKEVEAVAA